MVITAFIDASTVLVQACIVENNQKILSFAKAQGLSLARSIADIIEEILTNCNKLFNQIKKLVIGSEHGSIAGNNAVFSYALGASLGNEEINICSMNSFFGYIEKNDEVILDFDGKNIVYFCLKEKHKNTTLAQLKVLKKNL